MAIQHQSQEPSILASPTLPGMMISPSPSYSHTPQTSSMALLTAIEMDSSKTIQSSSCMSAYNGKNVIQTNCVSSMSPNSMGNTKHMEMNSLSQNELFFIDSTSPVLEREHSLGPVLQFREGLSRMPSFIRENSIFRNELFGSLPYNQHSGSDLLDGNLAKKTNQKNSTIELFFFYVKFIFFVLLFCFAKYGFLKKEREREKRITY